jgi:hypothetical protein
VYHEVGVEMNMTEIFTLEANHQRSRRDWGRKKERKRREKERRQGIRWKGEAKA